MDIELLDTLKLIISRYDNRTQGSVFISMSDFSWYNQRNGQLSSLYHQGYISKPRFYDNGVEISLTQSGRQFFEIDKGGPSLTKDKIYEILSKLNNKMEIPEDCFGYEKREANGIIKQLQNEGLIAGAAFAEGGSRKPPLIVWLDHAYVTMQGLDFLENYKNEIPSKIDIPYEFISACAKIADNPASYASFDEDGLNREIRNFMDSAITRFGYSISDQSQQGLGQTGKKAGELDIRICKNGIPIAIYEGLIHSSKQALTEHIDKSIKKYNQSGCRSVYVVEFSRNKRFGGFWDDAMECVSNHPKITNLEEVNTQLLGVKMLKGLFSWHDQQGDFYYIGVNCST